MNIIELLQRSRSLFESKQYLLAKEHLQAVLELNQNNIDALLLMAQCDEALGKTKEMASSLYKTLSIDTSNVHAIEKLRNYGFLGKVNEYKGSELVEKISEDGSVYLLPIKDDKIDDGFGAVIHDSIFYAGMFKDGNMSGYGMLNSDGIIFAGMFNEGLLHGHGMMQYPDGKIFIGNFDNSKFIGKGTLITDSFQVKTTFIDGKPDGKTPIELKWKNGNMAVASIDNNDWEDTSNWYNIEFYTADGRTIQMDFENGDSIDFKTGVFFKWKDDGDFRGFHWGDSKRQILMEEKDNEPIEIDNLVMYPALVADFACSVCFGFEKKRLSSGGFMFEEEYDDPQQFAIAYNKISSFFTRKYGNPTKTYNSLVWYVNFATNLTMLKWKAGVRKIVALFSPSSI